MEGESRVERELRVKKNGGKRGGGRERDKKIERERGKDKGGEDEER